MRTPQVEADPTLPAEITIYEVGARDGLQNEKGVLEPALRAELVNRLAAAGLPAIEAVSFVHPERVPAMAGAEEVVAGIRRREGVVFSGLVLNAMGAERFAATDLDDLKKQIADMQRQIQGLAKGS